MTGKRRVKRRVRLGPPGLRAVVAVTARPRPKVRARRSAGTRLGPTVLPWLARRTVGPPTRRGGVLRKRWLIPLGAAAAGLGIAAAVGSVPALRRSLKTARM